MALSKIIKILLPAIIMIAAQGNIAAAVGQMFLTVDSLLSLGIDNNLQLRASALQ